MILLRVIFLNLLSPNESFLVKPVTVSSTVEIIKALFILGYLNLKVSTDPLEPKIILCILVFNQFILYKIRSIQHVRTQITIHQIMLYLLNIYTRKKLSSPHLHYPTSYPPPIIRIKHRITKTSPTVITYPLPSTSEKISLTYPIITSGWIFKRMCQIFVLGIS